MTEERESHKTLARLSREAALPATTQVPSGTAGDCPRPASGPLRVPPY